MTHAIPTNTTVTIIHPTATVTDPYGSTRDDWATATRTSSPAWLEQIAATEETGDGRQAAVSQWLLMLNTDSAVEHLDRVEHHGRTFEVIAPPDLKRTLAGPHHIEARLRLVQT